MPYFAPFIRFVSALALLAVIGCGESRTEPTGLQSSGSTVVITPAADLGADIRSMIASGFPKGHATSITAQWDQVLRSIAREPKVTLKGKLVPNAGGRSELIKTVTFIQKKAAEVTPPAGETKAHFVARLVLYMSLYVYGGPASQPPPLSSTSDVVLEVVLPATTDTVITPAQKAAVIFPAGAVAEPTIIVITPVSTYYPANCSGPLDTSLCQYPLFYHFNVFPDVKLAVPAKVQVCHVDAGTNRRALADHDRFRLAHEKPTNPADYSAGSTIVDNVEILAYALMGVTKCVEGGGTVYTPPPSPPTASLTPFGRLADVAYRLAHRAAFAAKQLVTPTEAYAIDVGGGGFAEDFSIFGNVDPLGQADLAQSTAPATAFTVSPTDAFPGEPIAIASWQVRNGGSKTSGAFTSVVRLSPDSLMTTAITPIPVGGAASLVPGATHTYGPTSLVLPIGLAPGTYFIGTIVTPPPLDSNAANNKVSRRITVRSPTGSITGQAINAFNSVALAGATITAGALSAISNADGTFRIDGVPPGTVNVLAAATGFISASRNGVTVGEGATTALGTVGLVPVAATLQMRIVLDWGSCSPAGTAPCDLDSHLSGPAATPLSRFHVYYGSSSFADALSAASLNLDDTNGDGPETITLSLQSAGTYQYYVHNYSGAPAFALSSARVRVFVGPSMTPTAEFNVPQTGAGNGWHVFSLSGGTITPVNTLMSMSPSFVMQFRSAPASTSAAVNPLDADLERIITDIRNSPKSSTPMLQGVRQP